MPNKCSRNEQIEMSECLGLNPKYWKGTEMHIGFVQAGLNICKLSRHVHGAGIPSKT